MLLKLCPPFYTNKLKEITKTPKIYFIDIGLRNGIIKNFNSEPKDKILENLVFDGIVKKEFFSKILVHKSKSRGRFHNRKRR